MARGGARPNSGPAPDPNAARRERADDKATWVTLPGSRTEPAPEWPLSIPASPAEASHWQRAWATPQAHQWEALGATVEVALYVRSLAEAEIPGAAANLRSLVKSQQESLGVSITGMNTRRWRIAATDDPTTDGAPAPKPSGRPSARDRFRVVPPLAED